MSAVRLSLGQENFHIFNKDSEKHFLYVCLTDHYESFSVTNLEKVFETNNTLWSIVQTK